MHDDELAWLLGRATHAIDRRLAYDARQAERAVGDGARRHPIGLRHFTLDDDLLVERIGQQARLADREAREARIADIGDVASFVALIEGDDARRQARFAVVGQADRGQRVTRGGVGLIERETRRRHLPVDDRDRQGAAVLDADRARELEDHLRGGIARLDLFGSRGHLGRRRRRWRHGGRPDRTLLLRAIGRGRRHCQRGFGALLVGRDTAAIDTRHQPAGNLDRYFGAGHVVGVVESLVERHRPARHEREFDVLPILAAQILDDGPALQARARGGRIGAEGEAVGGLPDRHLDDVGHAHRALALPAHREVDGARVLGTVPLDGDQRLADLVAQRGIGELQVLCVFEDELLQAAVGVERDPRALHRALVVGQRDAVLLDRHDAAGDRTASAHRDLSPLQGLQQLGRRTQRILVERKVLERLRQRFATRQAEPAHAALVVIDDQALQHVVDLAERHRELQGRVALDARLVFEIAETARGEHDPLQREVLGKGEAWEREKAHQGHDVHQKAHGLSRTLPAHRAQRL